MKQAVYLDHFATTPADPQVVEAMLPYFSECFGNPHSLFHCYGWQAAEAVERARQQVAALLGAKANEIIFTSGATESNNLAVKGVAEQFLPGQAHIISVATEHRSLLSTLDYLKSRGYAVTLLPVDSHGLIDLEQLHAAIQTSTRLISVMMANNETGVVQPIQAIGQLARQAGIAFHCDATQAVGKLSVDVISNSVDLLTLSGHKIYGPKGSGALYVRRTACLEKLLPQMHGGGQELGLRSGTLNVPAIVGLGVACALAGRLIHEEAPRLQRLRDQLQAQLLQSLSNVTVNANIQQRLPNALSISIGDVAGEQLLQNLRKIALSSGSTCGSVSRKSSHVLRAMGLSDEAASATLRLSLGRFTTEADIDFAGEYLIEIINKLRRHQP